jgi:hypothetical protein
MSWTIRITHTNVAEIGVGRGKPAATGRPAGSEAVRIYLDRNTTTSSHRESCSWRLQTHFEGSANKS